MIAARIASYDPESWYYDWERGMPLQLVIDRWQKQRSGEDRHGNPLPAQKVYDRSMPAFYTPNELWPHREYTWTREGARSGHVKIKGQHVFFEGPEKWDVLVASMKERGWDPKDPLHFYIGKQGAKVAEGNHRLAIAREIGIRQVPTQFFFSGGSVTKSRKPEPMPEVTPKAIKKVVLERDRPADPATQRQVDKLMKMLGW